MVVGRSVVKKKMCSRGGGSDEECGYKEKKMGLKILLKLEKSKILMGSKTRMRLWMIRAFSTVFLWACVVHLLVFSEVWGPKMLKDWPSCCSHQDLPSLTDHLSSIPPKVVSPPKSESLYFSTTSIFVAFCLSSRLNFFGLSFVSRGLQEQRISNGFL